MYDMIFVCMIRMRVNPNDNMMRVYYYLNIQVLYINLSNHKDNKMATVQVVTIIVSESS